MSYNPQTPRRVGGASRSSSSDLFGKPGSLLFGTPHSNHNSPSSSSSSSNFESGWGAGSTWKPIQHPAPPALSSLGYFAFPPVSPATGSSSSSSSATTTTAFSFGLNASFGSFRSMGGLGNKGADSDSRTASTSASTAAPPPTPTPSPPAHLNTSNTATATTTTSSSSSTTSDPDPDLADAYQTHLAHLHTLRITREASEARKGEEYWVSCGGVLRDEHGRRDLTRTRAIREELRLREVERVLLERWEAYEGRWRALGERVRRLSSRSSNNNNNNTRSNSGSSSLNDISNNGYSDSGLDNGEDDNASLNGEEREFLTFADIPWPIDLSSSSSSSPTPTPTPTPTLLTSLTPALIEPFLLLPLTVRSNTTSKKERIRSSLLRWHPDKLAAILALVEEGTEREAVLQGVHAVFRCLQRLNSGLV